MSVAIEDGTQRSWKQALWRGFQCCCPACGRGALFRSFLKCAESCPACGEELHHQRADDAPPYFTMVIVGHVIVPTMLVVEKIWKPDLLFHAAIWLPLTLILTLALLPRVKGAVIGMQWANRMHGFGAEPEP
jgi:uncharacterized protein (DUF983 family)